MHIMVRPFADKHGILFSLRERSNLYESSLMWEDQQVWGAGSLHWRLYLARGCDVSGYVLVTSQQMTAALLAG
jgi:hypothetical protein